MARYRRVARAEPAGILREICNQKNVGKGRIREETLPAVCQARQQEVDGIPEQGAYRR